MSDASPVGRETTMRLESIARTMPYGPGQLEAHARYEPAPIAAGTLLTTTTRFTVSPRWYALLAGLLSRNQLELGARKTRLGRR
jgi:hypothetical protein